MFLGLTLSAVQAQAQEIKWERIVGLQQTGPGGGRSRVRSRAISDFNNVAVRVGEISVSNTGRVFAAARQFSAGSFDLLHAIIQPALVGECEAEMRHTAASNRLTLVDFAERDYVVTQNPKSEPAIS
jgi:hypothetical protein